MTAESEVLKTLNWMKERIESVSALSAWPVGSVFISVNDTNPSTLLGGGTWQKIEDCFLLASGSKALGATGGEETVTLSVNQIPSHNHGGRFSGSGSTNSVNISGSFGYFRADTDSTSMGTGVFSKGSIKSESGYTGGSWVNGRAINMNSNHSHTFSVSGNINNQGGGQSHNNMPPYRVVSVWQRIA